MAENKLSAVVQIDGTNYEVTAKNAEQLGGVAASSYALKSDLVAETKLTIVNKTQSDTADTVYAVTNLAEDPNNQNGHYVTPTYTAVPTKKYVDDNKQAKLVSGTNIKTVNGESLLGSGDITITGGGGSNVEVDSALSASSTNPVQNKVINAALGSKVDKVSGKGLSTNDYTTDEKQKLAGIATGAEVNVQSDWSVTDTSSDAFIKNKPTIPTKTSDLTNDSGFKKITVSQTEPTDGATGDIWFKY